LDEERIIEPRPGARIRVRYVHGPVASAEFTRDRVRTRARSKRSAHTRRGRSEPRSGPDWESSPFDAEQFRTGLGVELEHGRRDDRTNVTDDDRLTTGKIAWAAARKLA
jgi:hypothetical protein